MSNHRMSQIPLENGYVFIHPDISERENSNAVVGNDSNVCTEREMKGQEAGSGKRRYAKNSNIVDITKLLVQEGEQSPVEEELKFLDDFVRDETEIENEHRSSEYFNTVKLDELISFVFAMLSIGSGVIYYELKAFGKEMPIDQDILALCITVSLVYVSIVLTMIPKYIHYMKLYKSALYIGSREGFFETSLWRSALFECVLCIVHPNYIFKDWKYTTNKSWNIIEVEYAVNDFLVLVLLTRVYYILRMIVTVTKFYGARADRVAKMMGNQLSAFFSFKCLLIKYPLPVLLLLTLISALSLGYMMKVLEGPVFSLVDTEYQNYNDYRTYSNCFWNMLVTMTTVGYGDYYPLTVLGRLVIIITAVTGIILVALNISFLQSKTQLTENEQRAYDFVSRLEAKEIIRKTAANYFRKTMQYFIEKKMFVQLEREGRLKEKERRERVLIQTAYEKLKTKRRFKGVVHQFQNVYGAPNDVDLINQKIDKVEDVLIKGINKTEKIEGQLTKILIHLKREKEKTLNKIN